MAYTYAELLACVERRIKKREIELMEEVAAMLRALDEGQATLTYHDNRPTPQPSPPILLKVE